jgi:hypothetical protein
MAGGCDANGVDVVSANRGTVASVTIARLRAEASALLSGARDLETLLPYPPEHSCGAVCEFCRLRMREAVSDGYRW